MKFKTKLLAGNGIILVLMSVIAIIVYTSINTLIETSKWVEHTHAVISNAKNLEKLLVDMETGERGFLIAGKDLFLEPYTRGKEDFEKVMTDTRNLVGDNPAQLARLKEIGEQVKQWIRKAAEPEILMRREMNKNTVTIDQVTALIEAKTGKRIVDSIRENFDHFIHIEERLLVVRKNKTEILDAKSVKWVEHTYQVIGSAKDLQKYLVDMETGERGYLITGSEEFLEPFYKGKALFEKLMVDTKQLVNDNPNQVELLEQISAQVKNWINKAATPEILLRREMNEDTVTIKDVSALVEKGTGKNILDGLRNMLDEFTSVERDLLFERENVAKNTALQTIYITIVGTIFAVILGAVISLIITRSLMKQIGGEPDVIAEMSREVARGNLDISFKVPATGTTGIYASLINMIDTLKSIADQADIIASGDYSVEITRQSDDDRLGNAIHTMKNQIAERTQEVEKSNSIVRGIVDTALDGIFSLSKEEVILTVNAATEKLFQYTPDEIIGKKLHVLIPSLTTRLEELIGTGKELKALRQDGSSLDVFLTVGEAKLDDGKIFTIFIRDITKDKQFEADLQRSNQSLVAQNEMKTQIAKISDLTQGASDMSIMCEAIISELARRSQSGHGVLYVVTSNSEQTSMLSLMGSYAFKDPKNTLATIQIGEGLIGQCAKDKKLILITQAPEDYIQINSALGEYEPLNILLLPVLFEQDLMAVIELASFQEFSDTQLEILQEASRSIGVSINNLNSQGNTQGLLKETLRQAEELQAQQEELKAANESLQEQTNLLKTSEEELRQQSVELKMSKEGLENKLDS